MLSTYGATRIESYPFSQIEFISGVPHKQVFFFFLQNFFSFFAVPQKNLTTWGSFQLGQEKNSGSLLLRALLFFGGGAAGAGGVYVCVLLWYKKKKAM